MGLSGFDNFIVYGSAIKRLSHTLSSLQMDDTLPLRIIYLKLKKLPRWTWEVTERPSRHLRCFCLLSQATILCKMVLSCSPVFRVIADWLY